MNTRYFSFISGFLSVAIFSGLGFFWGYGSVVQAGNFGFGIGEGGSEFDNIEARRDVKINGVDENQETSLLNIVKSIVNRVLSILALVALLFILYGGFQMVVSAGNEEKYNSGWKFLKSASIGLILVGTAWFILSLIFRVIVQGVQNASPTGTF